MTRPNRAPHLTMADDLADAHDLADWIGVTLPTIRQWRQRHAEGRSRRPFPRPVRRVGGSDVWDRQHVARWLELTGRLTRHQAADRARKALYTAMWRPTGPLRATLPARSRVWHVTGHVEGPAGATGLCEVTVSRRETRLATLPPIPPPGPGRIGHAPGDGRGSSSFPLSPPPGPTPGTDERDTP